MAKRKRIRKDISTRQQIERQYELLQKALEQIAKDRAEELETEDYTLHLQTPAERKHIVSLLASSGVKVNAIERMIYVGEMRPRPSAAVKGTIHHLQNVCNFKVLDERHPLEEIRDIWRYRPK